jgi:hypothetical protein
VLNDPDYGRVACAADGVIAAEGRVLDPSTWTIAGAARTSDGREIVLPSQSDKPAGGETSAGAGRWR